MITLPELFPVGRPALGDEVVDREDFIAEVALRLHHRNSVILTGPRRLGKTSVARAVLERLRQQEGALTAALDLSGLSSPRELAARLTTACLANDPALRTALSIREGLGTLLRLPQIQAKLHDLELSLALRTEGREPTTEALLDQALEIPERMAAKDGRLFVVLLDEFQAVTGLDGSQLLARMRSHFQLQGRTAFMFLGSQAGIMAHLFGAQRQPFFRFATMLELPPVPQDAWRTYIRGRLDGQGVRIDDAALDVILDYTGGHPADTMAVAFEAYLAAGARGTIDAATAWLACTRGQDAVSQVIEAELSALSPKTRAVLGRVAKGLPLYEGERSRDAVRRAVADLLRSGALRRTGRGRYEIAERMLARYLLGGRA